MNLSIPSYTTWGFNLGTDIMFEVCSDIPVPKQLIHRADDLAGDGVLRVFGSPESFTAIWRDYAVNYQCGTQPKILSNKSLSNIELRSFLDRVFFPLVHTFNPTRMALHASSTLFQGEAILFLGASGQGKSSTALALMEKGFPMISDDVVAIEDAFVLPGASSARVQCSDPKRFDFPGSGKARVEIVSSARKVPIRAIVSLVRSDRWAFARTQLQLQSVLPFLFDLTDWAPENRATRFKRLASLIRQTDVYEVHFPVSKSGEPDHVDYLVECLNSLGPK